jgi:hypothetical protein
MRGIINSQSIFGANTDYLYLSMQNAVKFNFKSTFELVVKNENVVGHPKSLNG